MMEHAGRGLAEAVEENYDYLAEDGALGLVGSVFATDVMAGTEVLRGEPIVAVCGIARSEKFFAMLRHAGAQLHASLAYPDHHRYEEQDWREIVGRARDCRWIVTTEKDLVKLGAFSDGDPRLVALRIDVAIARASDLLDAVCAQVRLDEKRRGQHDRRLPRDTDA